MDNSYSYPTPITPSKARIGWIGIGLMGSAMASHLLSAGYHLTIYARTPSKAQPLISQGAHLSPSPTHLAQSSHIIFTMLGHPSDVEQVILTDLIPYINPNTVLVDHTSSLPSLAKQISAAAQTKHSFSIDAPVSGGDTGAREGKLAILAGGDCNVVKWLTPLFDLMGRCTYFGESGCGQSCKIANQISVAANLTGLSEGLFFAEKAGLDLETFLEAVKGGAAGSRVMELFGERMIKRDFEAGAFAEYIVKDLGMALDDEKAVALPGTALYKQLFSAMVANGDGKLGIQGLITVVERMNGK